MANEAHDPWALLRDAREWLGHGLPCATICGECIVIARIDAALAEHDAAPPSEEKVEWTSSINVEQASVDDAILTVFSDYYQVIAVVEKSFATLDEAKSAAIAAARGMK